MSENKPSFTDEQFEQAYATDPNAPVADQCETFLEVYYYEEIGTLAQAYPSERTSLHVSWTELAECNYDLAQDYLDVPERIGDELDQALRAYDLPIDVPLDEATVQVHDLPDEATYDVGQYRPNDVLATQVSIRGQVSKTSERQTRDIETTFECLRCGAQDRIIQGRLDDGSLQTPGTCPSCEREGPFQRKPNQTVREDFQQLILQALPEAAGTDAISTETVTITLSNDLVGTVSPGDRILANATIHETQKDDTRVFELFAVANSIDRLETGHEDIELAPEDKEQVEAIAAGEHGDPFELVRDSIAPGHMGDKRIKEALAYQLFGGNEARTPAGDPRRGTSHVLLVGSPSTGKSGLMKSVERLAPRSVFTNGKGASRAGLTAAAVQNDPFGGSGWTLEAGALVRAHTGVACIDELDKMDESDQGGLLECMSDQRISIAKAGITATLPAQTTVLAAANPKGGTLNRYDAIGEQLGFNPVLLSRFDLVFTLDDEPDEERDREISEHQNTIARVGAKHVAGKELDEGELERVSPPIDPDTYRKYVAYARQLTPILTEAAGEMIVEHYVELRQANADDENAAVPVAARANEGLARLAEASARIRLSDTVDTEDVERARDLVMACLSDLGMDHETGNFDAGTLETGATKSQKDRKKDLSKVLRELERTTDNDQGVPIDDYLDECEQRGYDRSTVEHEIEQMKRSGDAYEPSTGFLRGT